MNSQEWKTVDTVNYMINVYMVSVGESASTVLTHGHAFMKKAKE